MKVLYAIQGTGNGHMSRAIDLVPELKKHCNLDILVSGYQSEVEPPFTIKYKLNGLSFIFGKRGGIDFIETFRRAKIFRLLHDIYSIDLKEYDLIINDFEPITAWAAKLKGLPCLSLSHQAAVIHPKSPKPPTKDLLGTIVLKYYAPASKSIGFHFKSFAKNISTPIIKKEIRDLKTSNHNHNLVYLPSFDHAFLAQIFEKIPETNWHIFSKHTKKAFNIGQNVNVYPIGKEQFLKSLASCKGVLCGAGFELPSEALTLGKKLLVVPMSGQYEQHCNAAGLNELGIKSINTLTIEQLDLLKKWNDSGKPLEINYPDQLQELVQEIFESKAWT